MGGMPVSATWDQDSFRFYLDDAAAGSATAIAAVNTSPTNLTITSAVRVRFLIQETAGSNSSETPNFKLQYRINTGGGFGSWADIGTGSPGMTSALTIEYADGDNASQLIGAGTFRAGKLKEASTATGALTATAGSDEYEVEWCVASTSGATDGDIVELRVVVDDGDGSGFIACDTITNTPSFTLKTWSFDQDSFRWRNDDGSETAATWKAAANVNPTDIGLDENVRLRFLIQELGVAPGAVLPSFVRLEFRQDTGGGFGSWTTIGSQGSTALPVRASLSSNFADGDATTQQVGSGTFYAGTMEEQSSSAYQGGLLTSGESEFEFCLEFNSTATTPASAGDNFEFRLSSIYNGSVTTIPTITNTPAITIAGAGVSVSFDALSYTHTLPAQGVAKGWKSSFDALSFSHTLPSLTVSQTTPVALDALSFSHSLNALTATVGRQVGLDALPYALTLQDVTASKQTPVALDALSYAHTLNDLTATVGRSVALDAISYAHTLNDVTAAKGWAVSLDAIGYTETLLDVTASQGAIVSLDALSYAHSLNDVAAAKGWASGLDALSYAQTLQDVSVAVGNNTPVAFDALGYNLTLNDVSAQVDVPVNFDALSYTQSLLDMTAAAGRAVALDSLGYTHTLPDVGVTVTEAVQSDLDALSYGLTLNGIGVQVTSAASAQPGGGYAPWEWRKVKAAEDKRRAAKDLLAAKERALEAESFDRATGKAGSAPLADAGPGQKVSAGQPFDITRVSAALAPEASIDPRTAQLAARMDRLAAQVDRARRQIEKEKARVANDNEAIAALLMVI